MARRQQRNLLLALRQRDRKALSSAACRGSERPELSRGHPESPLLYAVNEEIDHTGKALGEVSAFAVNPAYRRTQGLNRVSSKGGMPCHICTDKTGSVVAVANWSTGSTVTFPVKRDGSLGEAATFYQHTGEGGTQHCHCVNVTPDNRYLIATDTGLNKVFVHRLNTKEQRSLRTSRHRWC